MKLEGKIITVLFTFLTVTSTAQMLDQAIKMGASDIGQKILKKNKNRIAVADFVNNAGKSDALTKYVTEQFENALINVEGDIQIMDRKHISQLLSDNHLVPDGLIDEKTAKRSSYFIKVDGWAIGEIISFGEQIKISIKIIDVNSSLIYAAHTSPMIIDVSINKFKESTIEQADPRKSDCLEKSTGDLCFKSLLKMQSFVMLADDRAFIKLQERNPHTIIEPGETQCFYGVKAVPQHYCIWKDKGPEFNSYSTYRVNTYYHSYVPDMEGQIKVEPCKTKTYEIR